jgi:hypothetical protein
MGGFNVYLGFGRTIADLAWLIGGSHTSVALFVDTDDSFSMFAVTVNSVKFEEVKLGGMDRSSLRELRDSHDFLLIASTQEEHDLVLRTCRACVTAKIGYNYHDVMLMNVPFRTPDEKDLFKVQTLHDAQAAILILRECLGKDNPALPVVKALHSRTTMCCQLYVGLAPVCPPFRWATVVREPVQSRGKAH